MYISIYQDIFSQSLTKAICYPIQRVQIAQQTHAVHGNVFQVVIKIATTEPTESSSSSEKKPSPFKKALALYKGLDASMMCTASKLLGSRLRPFLPNKFAAFIISPLLSFPFDTVHTKLASDSSLANENVFTVLKKVFDEEGLFGLYRGFPLQVIGAFTHSVFYMMIYSAVAPILKPKPQPGTKTSFTDAFICGTVTSILTNLISYPFSTVIRRLQAQTKSEKKSVIQTVKSIAKDEGINKFYSGFPAGMIHLILCTPAYFVFDIVYSTLFKK